MPYSLNSELNGDLSFEAQSPGNTTITRPVTISFNGSGIHLITGPTPFMDISKSYNRTNTGELESILNTITLTGKIIRPDIDPPPQSGIQTIIGAISGLKNLFSCSMGTLAVECKSGVSSTTKLLEVSGVRVKDVSVNKSSDNWVFSADYTIGLEYYEAPNSNLPAVQNTNDSWSIEPIDDYVYSSFSATVNAKTETHNPQLKPTAIPGGGGGGGAAGAGGSTASTTLKIINIPQYRISRRVSAVGLVTGSGSSTTAGVCTSGLGNTAYQSAKKWVEARLGATFNGPTANASSGMSGLAYVTASASITNFRDTFLYNHSRSINFSITDGSYEVNDTWLAMPTGVKYVEDYSVECSTDDKFVKTVRVQGNIRGLYMSSFEVMKGNNGSLPPTGDGYIGMGYGSGRLSGGLPGAGGLLDTASTSTVTNFASNTYENANSGWLYDIKPYLYRRASLVIDSSDRNQNYVSSSSSSSPPPPNNPIYCHESLLNTIPVSTTEGHDPRKGTISYSYEYNNRLKLVSGVIAETISITENGPTDVFSEAFVIGRQLGPVLQSLGTKTSTKKDLTIEVTVVPPSSIAGLIMTDSQCPLFTGGAVYKHIQGIVDGLKPFGARANAYFGSLQRGEQTGQVFVSQDNHSWNPTEGRYSRSVSWVYQQCSVTKFYLDH